MGYVVAEIRDQYLLEDENRPWIVGFSGGKDSTALLQLVWYALLDLSEEDRRRKIYVVCNNTLVENPVIQRHVEEGLQKIKQTAIERDFPIFVETTTPRLEDTFWVNTIGRGYPVPNNAFRWCTERMKIAPTSRLIMEKAAENGHAVVLIGTRRSESAARARSVAQHSVRGQRLHRHPHHGNTSVYAPIKDLQLEEVWYVINALPSPWEGDNSRLFKIYSDASADDYECPTVVTDKSHGACGQSRFGCWTCTVVKEDKSLRELVGKGESWLAPLLDLRMRMQEERNESENRMPCQRNGQPAVSSEGINQGAYTPAYRAKLLEALLIAQRKVQETHPEIELISNQELIAIGVIWLKDLIFSPRVSDIYNRIYNKTLEMEKKIEKLKMELELLQSLCADHPADFDLIQQLLDLQESRALLNRKHRLIQDMENLIEESLDSQKTNRK